MVFCARYADAMSTDADKYERRARLALISLALWLVVFIAFALLDALTDLNGFTGMMLGVIFSVMNAVLFVIARHSRKSAELVSKENGR